LPEEDLDPELPGYSSELPEMGHYNPGLAWDQHDNTELLWLEEQAQHPTMTVLVEICK
jgi:hypothetical protein